MQTYCLTTVENLLLSLSGKIGCIGYDIQLGDKQSGTLTALNTKIALDIDLTLVYVSYSPRDCHDPDLLRCSQAT